MEQDMFKVPKAIGSHAVNPLVIEGVALSTTSNPGIQPNLFDFNKHDQINVGLPTFQRDDVNGFGVNHHITTSMTSTGASAMASRPMLGRTVARDSHDGSYLSDNSNLTGHYAGGILIPAASLATLLMSRNSLQDDINNVSIPRPSMVPLDSSRNSASYDGSSTHSSLLAREAFMNTGFQSSQLTQNVDTDELNFSGIANSGVDQQNNSLNYNKDLSLSLASSLPFFYGTNMKDQGSDTFCSGVSNHSLTDSRFGSEKNSCHGTEVSQSVGANKKTQFSHIVSGSLYLQVIQDILAQIATYSLENLDLSHICYLPSGAEAGHSSQCHGRYRSSHELADMLTRIEVENDPASKHSFESKKAHLLALLQIVDDCYNQCLDEMHTVVSAFHAATELNPNIHACFALHTVSSMYKDLRERISKQILTIGATLHGLYPTEENTPETLCNESEWALQQLKRKDLQLWKPQRGLPERSVAVLKAWMFQNFLHPYPKDSEKHLLAIKSGLTRSQVSNWFINARVRIWKPLIEEMYSEINKRKAHQEPRVTTEAT